MAGNKHRWHIHGLKQRWFLTGVLTIFIVVLIFVTVFAIAISEYYYATVKSGLETKAKTATDFFANYITRTYTEYYDSAYKYIENFDDANVLELQFIGMDGRIQISSNAVAAGRSPNSPDVKEAFETGKSAVWRGESSTTGEKIMAVSAPMIYRDGQIIGVMRYVTSLKLVDREIITTICFAIGLGLLIVLFVIMANMFFIRGVVDPVRDITKAMRQIADGGYGVQITDKYRDEIGEMVDSINEMSMKISRSEKAQTEFISSVSHELRTPLTAITGWGETLIYDESLTDETRRGIGIILKEARRLTKMVEELLEFTRMQDGRFTLKVEKIDVVAEFEDSIFTYRELLKQDEIHLEYEPPYEEMPIINGDPERLKQVFLNILDNASKYGREGKRIIASISGNNEYVSIKIRDFGPGIPEDELEQVKMKFYKGSSKERGSGIGLAVCDEIIKYHQGQLILANADGGGLEVTVQLPIGGEL